MRFERAFCRGVVALLLATGAPAWPQERGVAELAEEAFAVSTPTRSAAEYKDAAAAYRDLLGRLRALDPSGLDADGLLDRDLLESKLRTWIWEIEELRLHEQVPATYFALSRTSGLFLRPGAEGDGAVREAVQELRRLPAILESARQNLRNPARTWTENALYQAWYARLLLDDFVPAAPVQDAALAQELRGAAAEARTAVGDFELWLERDLLPRSTRSPAWRPEQIESYQFVHEGLESYGVEAMLRIAEGEEARLTGEMEDLASRIHPSGDLRTVWELMKEEAPPWPEVLPMAQRYVDLMTAWLEGAGAHVVEIPDFDYGARLTPPMGRRTLSFGGASYGPTVDGRLSGYYVLTPLEDRLSEEEKASRLKAYNPYWTNVISYHEWLGHTVQRAVSEQEAESDLRKRYGSLYLSQAWSFYLEALMEEQGFYETLPLMEELKTRMARRQMRMWRVQRILTKCRMARGEMSFDEAVAAYVEKIGMEPANAFIEVQRDSQSPSPPGREIIGERVILEMREEYRRRRGEEFSLRDFHHRLLAAGNIPLPAVRELLFR